MTTTPIAWFPPDSGVRWEMFIYGTPLIYASRRKGPRSGPRKGMPG